MRRRSQQILYVEPARRAIRAASSCWSTRNRQPPEWPTSLDALAHAWLSHQWVNHLVQQFQRFPILWLPGIQNRWLTHTSARWPDLAVDDFWYSSMRRPPNPAAAQPAHPQLHLSYLTSMFDKDTPKHETRVPCVGKGFNPPWPTKVDPTTRHSCRLWALFHVNSTLARPQRSIKKIYKKSAFSPYLSSATSYKQNS